MAKVCAGIRRHKTGLPRRQAAMDEQRIACKVNRAVGKRNYRYPGFGCANAQGIHVSEGRNVVVSYLSKGDSAGSSNQIKICPGLGWKTGNQQKRNDES